MFRRTASLSKLKVNVVMLLWYHNCAKCLILNCTLQRNFELCIPRKGIARPQSQFPHSCVCERFLYSHYRSTYFPAAEYADRMWEYIKTTQKHVCRNWDCGHAVPFLGIYVSNFLYNIFAVYLKKLAKDKVCSFAIWR